MNQRGEPRGGWSLGSRIAPARFVVFLLMLIGGTAAATQVDHLTSYEALVVGFDVAAVTFLASLLPFLRISSPASIRAHALENDANRTRVLVVTFVTSLSVMAALAGDLPRAAKGDDLAIVVLLVTLGLTWLFANSIFALHYAHVYYMPDSGHAGKDTGGLEFPATPQPDYADFLYFSATLGMTFQTSDVTVSSRHMRRVVLCQSMAAFLFNLGIIGLVINALGGLAG